MRTSTRVLIAATLLQILLCGLAGFWPLRHVWEDVWRPWKHHFWRWLKHLYSLPDSNLDAWALSLLYDIVLIGVLFFPWARRAPSGSSFRPCRIDRTAVLTTTITVATIIYQLLLLAKAVIVAILGADVVLPDPSTPNVSGLAFTYSCLLAALMTSFAQAPAARAVVEAQGQRAATFSLATTQVGLADESVPLLLAEQGSQEEDLQRKQAINADGPVRESSTKKTTIASLVRLSVPDAHILSLAFSAGSIAALGQALVPYYTGRIVDYASIDPNPTAFKQTTLKLLAVAAGCAVFTGIRGGLFTLSMTRLNVRLRRTLFASLIRQEAGFFDTTKTGDITSRLAADTTTVSDQISLNLNVMLRSVTQAAMVLGFMFTASWRLTVVTFVMIPIVLAICKVYGQYYRKLSKKVQSELAEVNSVAEEALGSMPTVKAHAAEASTEVAYYRKLMGFYSLQKRQAGAYAAYMTTNTFLSAAVVAGVLYYGGTLVLRGSMSAGALVSFMLYQQSLSAAFQALGDVFSALSAAVGAADKVVELMHREPRIPCSGSLSPPQFSGRLELVNVTFSYPARPQSVVLREFNLVVNPGQVVALVGPSGGGKSSVVKLLQRLYLPSEGSVLIDGRDVGVYDPSWLRRRVALVSQEPVLYARSVRRNIMYGLEEEDGVPPDQVPTQHDIEEAAKLANAHEFVTALPLGYDTECGERGVQLSGGQKQRLAIARALVRRPSVLLLDEATSALDADSEALVQEALERTMLGRTVLVIAHRLSTVQGASRIVMVAGGTVVETGTHQELLDRGGAYATLVRRQLTKSASSASIGIGGANGQILGVGQASGLTPSSSRNTLDGLSR